MTNKFAVYAPPIGSRPICKELSPDSVTLAEIMKQNGYATGGFTGNAGVSGGFGYEQGFDVYYLREGTSSAASTTASPGAGMACARTGTGSSSCSCTATMSTARTRRRRLSTIASWTRGTTRKYTGSEQEQEVLREEGLEQGQLDPARRGRAVLACHLRREDSAHRCEVPALPREFDKLGVAGKTLLS